MNIVRLSKVKDVEYLGIPYNIQIHYFQKSELGKRVSVRKNFQTSDVEIKAIKGDGRLPDCIEYEIVTLEDCNLDIGDPGIMDAVCGLAKKYF